MQCQFEDCGTMLTSAYRSRVVFEKRLASAVMMDCFHATFLSFVSARVFSPVICLRRGRRLSMRLFGRPIDPFLCRSMGPRDIEEGEDPPSGDDGANIDADMRDGEKRLLLDIAWPEELGRGATFAIRSWSCKAVSWILRRQSGDLSPFLQRLT